MHHNNFKETDSSGVIGDPIADYDSRFTEMERVSQSAHNIVLRAKRFGRIWVLKGLAGKVRREPIFRAMLRKEFDIMMHLHHSGVVQASGLETIEGVGECIVMEYIDGLPLNEWIAQEEVTMRRRRDVASQIISTLSYIHGCGYVHRDLKPANIMVSRTGDVVKLIDFGLADSDAYDMLKQPAGTPGYIAPQQAEAPEADVKNDIYSLGCVLRRMELGKEYSRIIDRCLLPPDRRWVSINAMSEALDAYYRRRRHLRTGITIAAITGLILISLVSMLRLERITNDNLMTIDSLRTHLAATAAENDSSRRSMAQLQQDLDAAKERNSSTDSTLSELNDSVAHMQASLEASQANLRMAEERSAAALKEAEKKEAEKKLAAQRHEQAVRHNCSEASKYVDELFKKYTGKKNMRTDQIATEIINQMELYLKSLGPELTFNDILRIRQAAYERFSSNYTEWTKQKIQTTS